MNIRLHPLRALSLLNMSSPVLDLRCYVFLVLELFFFTVVEVCVD